MENQTIPMETISTKSMIDLCHKALQLTSSSFREELSTSVNVGSTPAIRQALLAINNRAETARNLRVLVSELAELSEYFLTDEDLDTSLSRVLTLSRQLLGSDAAFVMELDDASKTANIILSSGVWTTEFQEAQPRSGGLFFSIKEVDAALQVANYLFDSSITHEPELDQRVKREGVRAMMGIPMKRSDAPFRVLFVADRHERIYHTSDIYILEQLAIQAAVVCQQYYHRSHYESQIARLRQERDDIQSASNELNLHTRALEELVTSIDDPSPESSMTRVLSSQLGIPVHICNVEQIDALKNRGIINEVAKSQIVNYLDEYPNPGHGKFIGKRATSTFVATITSDHIVRGAIIATGSVPLYGERLINAASSILSAGDILGADGAARRRAEASSTFFTLVTFGPEHLTQRQRALLAEKGIVDYNACSLALLEGPSSAISVLIERIQAIASDNVLIGASEERIALLAEGDRVPTLLKTISTTIDLGALPVTGFLSQPIEEIGLIPNCFRQSEYFLKIATLLQVKSESGWLTSSSIPQSLQILSRMTPNQRQHLVRETIGPLLAYDAAKNTELLNTAKSLVEHQFSASATANALYVHVNTVRHRIRRIEELLGADWNMGLRLLDFQLAVSCLAVQEDAASL